MRLASARRIKVEDTTDDDLPSTSGRQFIEATSDVSVPKVVLICLFVLLRLYVTQV
jgi:hypothetical protein